MMKFYTSSQYEVYKIILLTDKEENCHFLMIFPHMELNTNKNQFSEGYMNLLQNYIYATDKLLRIHFLIVILTKRYEHIFT